MGRRMIWILIGMLLLVLGLGALYSAALAMASRRAHPPVGAFADIGGRQVHYVDVPKEPGGRANEPALVFIHGASGNLLDPLLAFRGPFEGRHRLIFVDRPGCGYSQRIGREDAAPEQQAAVVAALLDRLGVGRAVLVGHSWGGAVAAAFAVDHPDRTAGLVFLSAATHPWPGGVTWYYHLAAMPVLGRLFSATLVAPIGMAILGRVVQRVFEPNPPVKDYAKRIGLSLIFRTHTFVANAEDVSTLHQSVTRLSPRYREIAAPTVIISGDHDAVVYEELHSGGLARDIPKAELIWLTGVGHMPHHSAKEAVVEAIEKVMALARARTEDVVPSRRIVRPVAAQTR